MSPLRRSVAALVALPLVATPLAAQDDAPVDTLRVGTRVAAPFVLRDGEGYAGLSIALWDHVAERMGVAYVLEERDIEGLLAGVEDGSLDAAVAALTVTSEREARVDFSHPFYTTGLGIAVPHRATGFGQAVLRLFSLEFLWVFALLGGLILFWGALIWLFERAENPEQFGGTPAQGIGSGFWWAAVTMTTVGYGDKAPRSLGGRIVGLVWMFTAIVVISFFTAAIASSLTVTRLDTGVAGPEDLPRARVGTLQGSAAAAYLSSDGVPTVPFPSIAAGLEALGDADIDAFVHDQPILQYLSGTDFDGRTRVLPGTFQEQYYGIALPPGSPRRDAVNAVLLEYVASQEWAELRRRHLGDG